MICPYCHNSETIVKDSRETEGGKVVRRRRNCTNCNRRFTTFERSQIKKLVVIKKSGIRKLFDRNKIFKSIATAVRKRNVNDSEIEKIIDKIVAEIEASSSCEINSKKIGKLIMLELAKIDHVAYIRFASVYDDFTNLNDFANFIKKIKN